MDGGVELVDGEEESLALVLKGGGFIDGKLAWVVWKGVYD